MSVLDRFYKIHSENTIVITVSVVRYSIYIYIIHNVYGSIIMTRKKWCLIGAAILGLSGISASINPIAQTYVAPMVKEQVNNAINGSVNYDSLRIKLEW